MHECRLRDGVWASSAGRLVGGPRSETGSFHVVSRVMDEEAQCYPGMDFDGIREASLNALLLGDCLVQSYWGGLFEPVRTCDTWMNWSN